jgi:hypothetical protein
MANIGREQNFFLGLSWKNELGVVECPWFEFRFDNGPILSWLQVSTLFVGKTKAPASCVVGCDIRDRIRLIGQRMQVSVELRQVEPLVYRLRVTDNVKIVDLEVDDPQTSFVGDEPIADVPFIGNNPIEGGST